MILSGNSNLWNQVSLKLMVVPWDELFSMSIDNQNLENWNDTF